MYIISQSQQSSRQFSRYVITNIIRNIEMGKSRKHPPISAIPLFIDKLIHILQDDKFSDYIDWTSSQDSFIIKDINRFTDTVLPKYFKHSNFSSFIRQLNMYNFHKIRHEQGQNVYQNEYFKRHQKNQLKNIKRKANNNDRQDQLMVYQPANAENRLNQLKTKQQNLQNICQTLIAQNNKLIEQNKMMMKHLNDSKKQKNGKMEKLLVSLIMARGNNQLALPRSENGRMLSLTNKETPVQHDNNGFENFKEFFEDPDNYAQFKEVLRAYQNSEYPIDNIIVPRDPVQQEPVSDSALHVDSHLNNQKDSEMLCLSDFLDMDNPDEML